MITQFKIFESINRQPEVGDYVIIDPLVGNSLIYLKDYFNTHIGIIKKIIDYNCIIEFEDSPRKELGNPKYVNDRYNFAFLKYWSDNKEDLIPYIEEKLLDQKSKKYNL